MDSRGQAARARYFEFSDGILLTGHGAGDQPEPLSTDETSRTLPPASHRRPPQRGDEKTCSSLAHFVNGPYGLQRCPSMTRETSPLAAEWINLIFSQKFSTK
jgi:hypothetical protein